MVLTFDPSIQLKDNAMLKHSPHLFEEWDFEKNDKLGLNVYKVTKGSEKKMWWICSKCDSSYCSILKDRVKGSNCPYCRGLKVNHTNSLAIINPELASQWHPTKNGDLTTHDVTYGSNKKVWWLDNCRHEWEDSVSHRKQGRGCPYCTGKRINSTNSLYSVNPNLTKEWHPTMNGDMTPHDVTCNSNKKVWWLGKCGHEWETTIASRNKEIGCPYCSNKKVLIGYNDLNFTNPELAKLLHDYEDGYKYTQWSKVKVDWKCECGEIVKSKTISNVKVQGLSCPKCSDGISYPEKIMYHLLKYLGVNFLCEKTFNWSNNKRYDFYIPSLNMIIETHGMQHYKGGFESMGGRSLKEEQENDKLKRELALSNGIKYYIELDCRKSNIIFIEKSIMKSKLKDLLNLDDFNFEDLKYDISNSLVISVWNLWDSGMKSVEAISNTLNLDKCSVFKYLERRTVSRK